MGEKVKVVFPGEDTPTGLMGFISYDRLAEQFRVAGEIKQDERVTHFIVGNDGVLFRIEKRAALSTEAASKERGDG